MSNDSQSQENQQNLSFKEKLKLFQNGSNYTESVNEAQKTSKNYSQTFQENQKDQKTEVKIENTSYQKPQSSNSFQEKIKLFQNTKNEEITLNTTLKNDNPILKDKSTNQEQNIDNNIKDEDNRRDKTSNIFEERIKTYQTDITNNDDQKSQNLIQTRHSQIQFSMNNILKEKEISNEENNASNTFKKNNEINQASSSFKERMKIFQNEIQKPVNQQTNIKPIIPQDKSPQQNKEKISENIEDQHQKNSKIDHELDLSIQKNQSSSSFKERIKLFQKESNETLQNTDEKIRSSAQNIVINKPQKEQQEVSNPIKDRMKKYQNEEQNINLANNSLNNKEPKEDKTTEPIIKSQLTNSFQDRLKLFQNDSNDDSQLNIQKKVEKESTNINQKHFSILEKAQFVANNFHHGTITEQKENIDFNVSKGPQFEKAKMIANNIIIDLNNDEKVLKKINDIKNNSIERTTFFDPKYCIILKNSFILYLKSNILEILKKDKSLVESNLLSKVYLIKTVEMESQMEKISLFIDDFYKKKMHEIEEQNQEEEDMKDKNEINGKSMNYVMSEKESYKEISIQISCDEELNTKIPQDF